MSSSYLGKSYASILLDEIDYGTFLVIDMLYELL